MRTAVAATPDDVPLRLHLAELLLTAGHGDAAVGEVAAALQHAPGDVQARALMVRALAGTPASTPGADAPPPPPHAPVPVQPPAPAAVPPQDSALGPLPTPPRGASTGRRPRIRSVMPYRPGSLRHRSPSTATTPKTPLPGTWNARGPSASPTWAACRRSRSGWRRPFWRRCAIRSCAACTARVCEGAPAVRPARLRQDLHRAGRRR